MMMELITKICEIGNWQDKIADYYIKSWSTSNGKYFIVF